MCISTEPGLKLRDLNGAISIHLRKMLKEHQAKYAALSEEESRGIMEEILAMQIGISADANVEDNEEAEQMIRAITHGDIDNSVR